MERNTQENRSYWQCGLMGILQTAKTNERFEAHSKAQKNFHSFSYPYHTKCDQVCFSSCCDKDSALIFTNGRQAGA
jgi:hypothetical protein